MQIIIVFTLHHRLVDVMVLQAARFTVTKVALPGERPLPGPVQLRVRVLASEGTVPGLALVPRFKPPVPIEPDPDRQAWPHRQAARRAPPRGSIDVAVRERQEHTDGDA